jgi:RHS repeat-associated protein
MFKLRREHMEAFRPVTRAQIPPRILADLQKKGLQAERDPQTREVVATDSHGFSTRLAFYPDGLPGRLTQPSGATHHYRHDEEGRLAEIVYPGGERVEIRRDSRGEVVEIRRPEFLAWRLERDEGGRLVAAHAPDGSAVQLSYHPEGPLESLTDRTGAMTRYRRQSDGRLQAIVDPLGRETTYLTDGEGRLDAIVFPDGSRQEYAFDSEEQTAAITTRSGREVLHHFDENDSLRSIEWGDGSRTEFEFDGVGNLEVARNVAGEIHHTFDPAGNPLTETTRDGKVTYSYDAEERLIGVINPQGDGVEYEYDADGRLCAVRDWEGRESRIVYSAAGTISEIRYANGVVERQEYGRIGRQARALTTDSRGQWLGEQRYEYDLRERLTGAADHWGETPAQRLARRFEYDAESRLVAETDAESRRTLARYAYDSQGNLIDDNGTTVAYGLLDEPVRRGGVAIEIDGEGNVLRLPGSRGEIRCGFAADGTLRSTSVGGRTFRFEYDAFGRRVSKTDGTTTWRFGWAGQQLLWEEYQESPEVKPVRRDYLFLPDSVTPFAFRENGRTCVLQTDARGAVIRAFDEQGAVVWRATYDSFGTAHVEESRVRQPWRLAGQYEDEETGLHYNFARYYSPWLKTYLSRDPSWHKPEATNYSYARNDPWNRADPFGTIAPLLVALGAVAIGAFVGAGVAALTGGDPVAGAIEGGLTVAGTIVGGLLGGPVGVVVGGMAGGATGAFLGNLAEHARRGEGLCWSCALEAAGESVLWDIALLGLGRIPGVKRLVKAIGKKLFKLGAPLRKLLKKALRKAKSAAQKFFKQLGQKIKKAIKKLQKKLQRKPKKKGKTKAEKDAWEKKKADLAKKNINDFRRETENMHPAERGAAFEKWVKENHPDRYGEGRKRFPDGTSTDGWVNSNKKQAWDLKHYKQEQLDKPFAGHAKDQLEKYAARKKSGEIKEINYLFSDKPSGKLVKQIEDAGGNVWYTDGAGKVVPY